MLLELTDHEAFLAMISVTEFERDYHLSVATAGEMERWKQLGELRDKLRAHYDGRREEAQEKRFEEIRAKQK